MKIIKNFAKTIQFILQLSIFILILLVFIFGLSRQLFKGDAVAVRSFETWQSEIDYSLKGLIKFSNDYVAISNKNTQYNVDYLMSEQMIQAAKNLKIFIIVIFTLEGLYLLQLAFKYRYYTTLAATILILVSFIIFKNYAISNFSENKLIIETLKNYRTIIALICISIFISTLSCAFKIYLDKSKD